MKLLVTGGAGYIGSHFVKIAKGIGHEIIVVDNLSRGNRAAIPDGVEFFEIDLLDYRKLSNILAGFSIDAIVHFAAFAYVGESVEKPDLYYKNNVVGSLNLINFAVENNIDKFVFSSTCSVYGNPQNIPISEDETESPINPYAQTKNIIEKMLKDISVAYNFRFVSLRYFNAAGADPEADIGESHEPETHIIPLFLQTALGKRTKVKIFGDDYDTPDGTCIRDYIHVNDLADAHLKALKFLGENFNSEIINLGTGDGCSVNELLELSRKITNCTINAEIVERRIGDPAILVAENQKAKDILDWEPKFNLSEIIETAWKWHKNPKY